VGRFDRSEEWVHLTTAHLDAMDVKADDIRWRARVGNVKAFRRTADPKDRIEADTDWFSDHETHPLRGECANFRAGRAIHLGDVRYIRPTAEFRELRIPLHSRAWQCIWSRPVPKGCLGRVLE